jgi:hypothetical protein
MFSKRVLKAAGMRFLPYHTVQSAKSASSARARCVAGCPVGGPARERLQAGDAAYLELLDGSAVAQLVARLSAQADDAARLVLAILLLESCLSPWAPRDLSRTLC